MIKHDKSYLTSLDLVSIEKGFAKEDLYSIRIYSKAHHEVKQLVDLLNDNFIIYQYEDREKIAYSSDWDLFFWCNSRNGERDFSYITLNFNTKRTYEQRQEDLENVLKVIESFEYKETNITIQYTTKYNEEKVKDFTLGYIEGVKNKFIKYHGFVGKIKEMGDHYGFFKKGARKNYYILDNLSILEMALFQ